jgi:hypothetical protein
MIQGAPSQWCWAGSAPSLIMRRMVEGLTVRAAVASLIVILTTLAALAFAVRRNVVVMTQRADTHACSAIAAASRLP